MAVWPGFGVNYKALQPNWATDIAYFNNIGLKNLRVEPGVANTGGWTAAANTFWRSAAQTFYAAGFWVDWGISGLGGATFTTSNWQSYHDFVVAEAAYLQSQGIALNQFEIGNELEGRIDNTTITYSQLLPLLQQLAADVKAVYSLAPISYAIGGQQGYVPWLALSNTGSLDTISIHPYGQVSNPTTVNITRFTTTDVPQFYSQFGNSVYISEFNISAVSSSVATFDPAVAVSNMKTAFNAIMSSGISKALLYSWVGYPNADNQFSQLFTNGTMNPMWFDFFLSNPKYYTPRGAAVGRSATIARNTIPSRASTYTRIEI